MPHDVILLVTSCLQHALAAAKLEAQVSRLVELLANIISDTRGRVEKKQAQVCLCGCGGGGSVSQYQADRSTIG
jgi:hypothetical protein